MQAVGNVMFDDESTENQKLGNVKSMSRAISQGGDALSLVNSLWANSGVGVTQWVNNGDGSFSSDGMMVEMRIVAVETGLLDSRIIFNKGM